MSAYLKISQPLALVTAVLYTAAPILIGQIPSHGFAQAAFKVFLRLPAQFALNFAGVYGVAHIVTWSVLYMGDLRGVALPVLARLQFVQTRIIDTTPGAVTIPTDYSQELVDALRQPYTVAVDETALRPLGVKLGDKALYNGQTVTVAAVTRGLAQIYLQRD